MKKNVLCSAFFFASFLVSAQSATTNELRGKFTGTGVTTLFFYKNTLKMFNQTDNKDFDDAVKNIEKLRFLMIDKSETHFQPADFKDLLKSYKGESFEEIMTTRMDGRNFEVLLKDRKGSPLGTVILVSDSSNLYVMDMVGSIDMTKATSIFSSMEHNTDIQGKIKSMMSGKKEKDKTKHEEHGD